MTELYSSLFRSLLLRHLLDHPVHGKKRRWRVRSFSDLPQDVYQQLCELGRIAYKGILHGQQVIFSDLPEDFETLGLMQCAPELYADEGAAVSYNFLHLTVQEFLAAFHLSQQPVKKQIEHFIEYKEIKHLCLPPPPSQTFRGKQQRHHFHMVLRFLCGVRKFSAYPSDVLDTLCVDDDSAIVIRKVTFDTLHWLFEAKDNDVISNALGSSNIQFHRAVFRTVNPFDCFVLGYCVSHSNCTWKIVLYNIGDEGLEMLVRGAMEEETHCTGGISEINLSRNDITSEGMKHLLKIPKQLINKLQTLDLYNGKLDSESCATLAHLSPHLPHLKILDLSHNPNIGQGGTVPLVTSLTAHNSLEDMVLKETGIGPEDCQALSKLLASSTSLKYLSIGGNDLPPEAVELIVSGLYHNIILKRLDMGGSLFTNIRKSPGRRSGSYFSFQNTVSLASVLRTNHTLVYINLSQCDIDPDGACQLVSALCTNDTLQKLYLERNPIGVKGAIAFAEMLPKNKSLRVLNLSDDSIGEEGTQKLIDSLTHNTAVKELYLPKKYKSPIASSGVDRRVHGVIQLPQVVNYC